MLALAACGDEPVPAPHPCASGASWEHGDAGSPEMHPGRDCSGCHAQNDGPALLIAGTVFATLHEPDECHGVAGVTVAVEDADGVVIELVTNATGNLLYEGSPDELRLPITATLSYQGQVRLMPRYVYSTQCNECHTTAGAQGAPGRVLAPD